MRITRMHISGFGLFSGEQLDPAPGLSVVRGPNEAGKSTFLAFTRAMLFGFETGQYPALRGGKRGGWLEIEMSDGRAFRVERYGDRGGAGSLQVLEEDKDLGGAYLGTLLQGVESRVYRNIFAFGLSELTQFEALTDDEVAARIYGAGLGTGSVSGLDVENALREEREELFKPSGSKPLINTLLKDYADLGAQLRDRDLPAEYGDAGKALEHVEQELTKVRLRIDELDAERRRKQRIIEGWSSWLELGEAKRQREELGEVRTFEPDVLEQLSRLEAALEEAERGVETATTARDEAAARLEAAVVDEEALAQREALEILAEATRVENARQAERDRTERELVEARSQVEAAMKRLGGEWSIEAVAAFDDSVALRSEVSGRFRARLEGTARAVVDAKGAFQVAEERLGETDAQVEATMQRLAELEEGLEGRPTAETRERGLREVEDLVEQLEEARRTAADKPEADLAATQERLDERRLEAAELGRALAAESTFRDALAGVSATAEASARVAWQRFLPPAILGAAGVVIAIVLAVAEVSLLLAGVVLVASVGSAAAWAYLVYREAGPSHAEMSATHLREQVDETRAIIDRLSSALGLEQASLADVDRYVARLDEERRVLEQDEDRAARAEAAARDVERLEGELAAAARVVGLPEEPGPQEREALAAAIAEDRSTEARRDGLRERLEQLRSSAQTQRKRRDELAGEMERRNDEAAAAQAEWEDWLEAHGLARSYDRETAAQVMDSIRSAQSLIAALRTLEARAEALAAEHAAYVEQVRALASLLPGRELDESDLAAATALLAKRFADALAGERARGELARVLEEREASLAAAVETRSSAAAMLDDFLLQSESEDAEALRVEVDRSARASALEDRIAAATTTLTALSGPGTAYQQLTEDLVEVVDIDAVKGAAAALDRDIAELAAKRDELNQEAGGLRQRRARMEADVAATRLRQRHEDVESQLRAAAGRWTLLALAHEMLKRSRAAYEEAHRPAVIEKAERLFAEWTDGRYRRIIAPLGEAIAGAERSDGSAVEIAGLSRGTSEQLYLALRFGLVEHFVETSGEPLPIVMDDILVNFDQDRAARAARSIEQLSRTCQIIYFTCHPSTPLEPDLEHDLEPIPVG